MAVTYYQSNKLLDYNFGATAYSNPATLYVGLSTTTISDNGTGATEPSGGSYARVAVTNNKTNFGVAASGSLVNAVDFTFVESTASWGTITYVAIYDASTAGNMLYFQPLSTSRAVPINTIVSFPASYLTIQFVNS